MRRLILLALAAAAVVVVVMQKKPSVPQVASGYTKSAEGPGIFTRPNGITEAPLLIVYGGLTKFEWARKAAMERAMPDAIKTRAFGLFLDHTGPSLSEAIALAKSVAEKSGLAFTDIKAMGFSAGGIPVQNGVDQPVSFIGLIDPSTRAEFATVKFGNRGRMLYNAANWSAYPAIKAALPKVAARIVAEGGVAKSVSMRHSEFPKAFFTMFGEELTGMKSEANV